MMENLLVLGAGLIGGSVAKAAKQRSLAKNVLVVNRHKEASQLAVKLGVADSGFVYEQIEEVCRSLKAGDLLVIAVPVRAYAQVFSSLGDFLPEGVLLTDVGSTKVEVIEVAQNYWQGDIACFVPGHPIAGSEKSGVEAANEALFVNRRTILTPLEQNTQQAVETLATFWQSMGAEVDLMDAAHHDEVLAATSHLPHLLAYGLVDSLVTLDEKTEVFRYAAGGFRDFTRIAESDPVMWRDIFLANRDALLLQLENFEAHIADLHRAIEESDADAIEAILERAQTARKIFAESCG